MGVNRLSFYEKNDVAERWVVHKTFQITQEGRLGNLAREEGCREKIGGWGEKWMGGKRERRGRTWPKAKLPKVGQPLRPIVPPKHKHPTFPHGRHVAETLGG